MGTFSIWHWLIVLVVVLVLFGGGSKLSSIMGDVGKGLRSFKRNIQDHKPESDFSDTSGTDDVSSQTSKRDSAS